MKKSALLSILLAASAGGAIAAPPLLLPHEVAGYPFENYQKDFNKVYMDANEHYMRREIFERNKAEIIAHNADSTQLYKKGLNHLSDRTKAEFRRLHGFKRYSQSHELPMAAKWSPTNSDLRMTDLPPSLDYRTSIPPVLTAVKDQGNCGSCWAYSATEGIESQYALHTGKLFDLSQQQIISCAPNPEECGGFGGCTGATVEVAWAYVTENGGITEEWMYGYQSYFGAVPACAYNASATVPVVKTSGYSVTSPRNDANAVMQSLITNGPLSIVVDADAWQHYASGIFNGCDYAKNISLDHAVQLVGYGTDTTLGHDYWIVRNSWTADWGEKGFIRLIRESTSKCGWGGNAGACVMENQPYMQWTCGQCGLLFDTAFPNIVV